MLDNNEPTSYEEAMVGPDSSKCLGTMKSEIGSMYENQVRTLVDLPVDQQAIKYKWIFKTDVDGNVTIYKSSTCHKEVSDKFKELTMMRLSHS